MHTLRDVHRALRQVMAECEPDLVVVKDEHGDYYLDCRRPRAGNKPMFFGAVQIKKRYVSYHLMPVYVFPDLLADCPPALRKRMHGKSCFNFTKPDADLFAELRALTLSGLRRFRSAAML